MTLPTILVILFLTGTTINQVSFPFADRETCEAAKLEAPALLIQEIGRVPEAMSLVCVPLKRITRDA